MSDSVGDGAAEEAEECGWDCRDEYRHSGRQGGLRRPVRNVGKCDESDRIPKPAHRLSCPKEREVRGAKRLSGVRLRGGLKPHEWDKEAAECVEEIAEAQYRVDRAARYYLGQELQPRIGPEEHMQGIIR